MKALKWTFYLHLMTINLVYAQPPGCSVDPFIPVGDFGIFPTSFDSDIRPLGGITDTVAINQDFEFTFNVKIGNSATIQGIELPVQSLDFPTTSAITYLPELANFNYVCNPPNCVFMPNEVGCIKIFGNTTDPTTIGVHDVRFTALLRSSVFDLPLTFPEWQDGGNYYLFVKPCLANLNLQNLIETNSYHASIQITASGNVPIGNSVSFKAGNEIQLLPEFFVEAGAEFQSSIEDCPEN